MATATDTKQLGGWYNNPDQGGKNMRWWGDKGWTTGSDPTGGGTASAAPATSANLSTTNVNDYLKQYQDMLFGSFGGGETVPTKTANLDPNTASVADIVANYPGYATMDPGAVQADFKATGGAGKGGTAAGGTSNTMFSSIKSMLEPSTPYPTAINRVQEFQTQREAQGLPALEQQLSDLKLQQQDLYAQNRVNTAAERGKPVAQGVIEGRVTQETRNAQENLDAVQRQISYVSDQVTTGYNVINTVMNLENLDYQDAVTKYNSEFSKNLQVFDAVRGVASDMITIAQKQEDSARANLQIYANAITSGNLDPKNLTADQTATLAKLETMSGLPVGFVASLGMSPKDKIISTTTNNGITTILMSDASGNITTKSYGTSTVSGQTANETALKNDITAKMTLDQVMQKYGNKVSPDTILADYNSLSPWGQAKETAEQLKTLYNVTAKASSTALTASDINKAKQLVLANGGTDADVQRIGTDPDFANWVLGTYK